MAWYDRFLGIQREEKLNPSQYTIARDEGLSVDTREIKTNYRSAYENLEVVNRAVNMIVDDVGEIPFSVNAKLRGITPVAKDISCLLYTSPSPRDKRQSRMPSSA